MRISIRDVALRAKVSPKTVTNVLHGRDERTSPATRARVEQTVREMKYVPVRGMTQNRPTETHVIGLVFDNMDEAQSHMGMQTYLGLREGALEHGYDLMTVLRDHPTWAKGRPEVVFLDRRCDGYIFVNPHQRNDVFKTLVQAGIPVVSCYNVEVAHGMASVTLDNKAAMLKAVECLVQKGHRRIAHVSGMECHPDVNQRSAAFRAAMRAHHLDSAATLEASIFWDIKQNCDLPFQRLLEQKPSAVVCDSTTIAVQVGVLAEKSGLCVGQDLSLTGIDDSYDSSESAITSLSFSSREIGHKAVELLLAAKAGKSEHAHAHYIPVHLIERRSVAAIAKLSQTKLLQSVS